MAGFLRWLAPRYGEVQRDLRTEISNLREQAYQTDQHRRTPNIVANLAVGVHYFLTYAQEVGAVGQAEAAELWQRCWSALGDAAAAEQEHQSASDPVQWCWSALGDAAAAQQEHYSASDPVQRPSRPPPGDGGRWRLAPGTTSALI